MITDYDLSVIDDNIDYSPLDGKRILITGGTGFVGRWLSLAPHGYITTLSRLQYERGDWELEEWDYIVHLANVPPDRVIQCTQRNRARLLYASSGAALDAHPKAYARGKIDGENDVLESGANALIARMFTFCGSYMPNRFAVINMIVDAITTGVIKIRGDNVTRTYMYAADMAAWMWAVLMYGKPRTTYNVGSPYPVTMEELAREVQTNFDNPLITEDRIYFNDERPYYVPNVEKTMMECGVQLYTPFNDAIRRTVESYKAEYKNAQTGG